MSHRPRRRVVLGGLVAGAGWVAHPARAMTPLLARQLQAGGVALAAAQVDSTGARVATAARAGQPAPDEQALFEIGSITKTFTALLLADAVQRGRLALDDAVHAVLPGGLKLHDNTGAPLRWRDLATHRSGLPRLATNMQPAQAADPYADYGSEQLLAFLRGWQPTRARDSQFEYSNLGYGLLGQALAWAEGRPLAELLATRVLRPLGLQDEVFVLPPTGRPRLPGHDAQGRPVPAWHFSEASAGAGVLLASARGMARYAQAALGLVAHPLGPAFELCLRRHGDGAGPANPVGLAWLLAPLNGRTVFNHDGGTFGFASSIWLDPQRRRAAVVLANAAVPVGPLALHLTDEAVPLPPPPAPAPAEVAVTAAQVAPLAGRYALNPQFALQLRAEGARLFAQATGQGEFELFAAAPRRWFARVTPLEVVFDGDSGAPAALVLHQGGGQMRFVREGPAVTPR